MNKITYVTVLLLLVAQFSFTQENFKRISISNPNPSVIYQLAEQGIDFRCGADHSRNSIQLEVLESELQILDNFNVPYSIEIDDVSKFYNERAVRELPRAISDLEFEKSLAQNQRASIQNTILDNTLQYAGCTEYDWPVPSNFNLGSMGGCLTLSEMKSELDDMRTFSQNNSLDIVSVKQDASPTNQTTWGNPASSITNNGQTYSGQGTTRWDPETIYYVRITGNESSTTEGTRPQILFTSMIHSREVGALMSNIYFMWYLIENYNTDPAVQHLVDNNELYFIPVVNPDGLRWNEHLNSSGGAMQRKNLRPNTGGTGNTDSNRGVDLNRNFDYFWGTAGTGSSGTPTSDSYRGPSAASEPETQIIVDFTLARNFETCIWNHTYANVIPHPYGGNPSFVSGREDEMHKMHEEMTRYNRYVSGALVFTPANGIADDWMVGGAADGNGSTGMGSGREILATTPEHGSTGFWPSPAEIVPIAKRSVRISFTTAYFGGKYARFHDLTQSDINSLSSNLTFGIERIGQTPSNFTLTVTPISSNISSIISPDTQSGMGILQQNNVAATLTLNSGIQPNEKIEYNVKLANDDGIFYEADFEKYYQPSVLFSDDPDSVGISNWAATGGWTTTTDAYSGSTAIKDGASLLYGNDVTKTLTSGVYDLSGSTDILVQFYSKWAIERNFDFVEILGSTDGSTWLPLCGNYAKPESSSDTNDHAAKGAVNEAFQGNTSSGQVYDGDRFDNWVMEEILIDGSKNSFLFESTTARFRFNFRSDSNQVYENYSYDDPGNATGFFIDDFKIIKVQIPCDNTNPPTGINADVTTTALSSIINWDAVPSATYDLRYREIGAPSWTEVTDIATNSYTINGLTDATDYEVQVNTRCTSATSSYSSSINFTAVSCIGTTINSYPYTESFESGNGAWTQETTDDIDWTQNSGGTTSNNTGPSGASDGTQYLYTEASGNGTGFPNKSAQLISPCFDLSNSLNAQLQFDYHMFGTAMGTLALDISTNNGVNYTNVFSVSGQQHGSNGAAWTTQSVDLSAYDGQTIKLRFHGTTGTDFTSDMAIDKLNFTADTAATSAPPTAVCQNITVALDAAGSATIIPSQIDNGSSDDVGIVSYSLDIETFSCSDIGNNTVILTVEDGEGQIDTCSATVTITDNPIPTVADLPDLTDECSVTPVAPTATDCDGTIIATTGTVFPITTQGTTVVTWTYVDFSFNFTQQTQNVIIDDVTDPVPDLGSLPDIDVECEEINSLTPPTASDNCGGTVTVTSDGIFPITSNTTVTWTYDDGNGNTVTQPQNINILGDTTDPDTPTLSDVNVDCNGSLTAPTTTDNCASPITGTTTDTLSFVEGGSTVINWTFDDGNGNSIVVPQTYNYDDTTDPDTPTLSDVTVDCNGSLTAPTTTDNCASPITGTTTDTLSFIEGGSTVINWTFDDGNGNSIVVPQTYNYDDTTDPDTPTLSDVTVDCNGSLTAPTTTDNCASPITGTTTDTLSFIEGGSTVINWTFDDGNGNSIVVPQTYNYDDTTDPDTPTLSDVTVDCNGSLTAPTTTDNCASPITGTTTDTLSFVEGGSTVINWTFDDGNGNSIVVPQTYNYDDTTDPDTPTLSDVTVDCNGSLTAPTTTDNCASPITGTTTDTLSFIEGGSTVINWTFDDGNGNSIVVPQTYNYDDTTDPDTPTLSDVTVDCNGSLTAPTTTDNCASPITGTTTDTLSFVEGGSTVINWTFDDGNGNSIVVPQTYNYDDTTDPDTPTLSDVTVDCNGSLTAPTTTDNCASPITGTTTDTLSFVEGGSTVINWTFDDGNGNSIVVPQTYNYDDTTDPDTPTLSDVTVDCNGSLTAPTTTDNCASPITGTTTDTLSFVEGGSTVINWTFDDGNGNSIVVPQTYNYDDTTDPDTPTLSDVTVDCNGSLTAPTTTDNCASPITGTTTDTLSFVEGGSTVINWTFDDGNGNSIVVPQTYNYDDTTDPDTPTLSDVTVDCNGSLTAPTTTDNCASPITGTTTDTLSFIEGGSTVINWTFDDGNGNSIVVPQTYNYDDTTDPDTPTLSDVTVDCNGSLTAPTTTDNCASPITGTTTDTLSFVEGGSTVINWTFDDGNGNSIVVPQTYNYDDTTDPDTPTLSDVTVDCNGSLTAPTTTDNCASPITGTTTDTLSFVEGGSTVINWTFDDGNGNSIVVPQTYNYDDTTDPDTPTLSDVTVDCNGSLTAPTTTDNCASPITGTTTDTLSFIEGGSTVINWTFDDGNGNSIVVPQTYNYDDTTDPDTPTLSDVTVDCNGSLTAPTTTDNCASPITGTTTDTLSFIEGGSTVINWTFDDGNGNSIVVPQTYNYDDTTDPDTPTLSDVTVDCNGSLTAPTTTDNCASPITGTTTDTLSFVEGGSTVINWTFDDGNGNSIVVPQTYNYDDTTDPDTPTLSDVTVDCNGSLTAPTTTDNCASPITGTTTDTLSFIEGGSTVINWTFDDGNGNSIVVPQTYNYDDTTDPDTPTLSDVTVDCNGSLTAPTTTDNCASPITGTTTDTLSFVEGGSTVINWTFDDGNGNSIVVPQTYNYDDTTDPDTPTLSDVTVDCNGSLTAPTTTDNCASPITGTTTDTLSFVEGGSTVINWTFDDGNGNSIVVPQTYNYDDTTDPDTPTLSDVTVDCNGSLTAPTTTDNCASPITGTTTDTLSFIEGGSTVINWTFDDGNGNSIVVPQTYNYDDTTDPDTPTLSDVTVDCNGSLTAPTTTDNCASPITGTTTDTLSFVEGGSTVINWTFDDGNGNSIVVPQTYNYDDTTDPDTPTLSDVTVDCNGSLTAPTTTDNCASPITGTTTDTLSFVEGGSTVINWTFDDGNGNSIVVPQTYNYDDTTDPDTPTLSDVTVDCNGSLTAPTTTDNCASPITGTTTDTLSFVEGGSTVINWTFDDGNGNSIVVPQTYNYDDTTDPDTPTLSDVTVDCNGSLTAPTTTDNCASPITGTTTDTLSFVEGGSTVINWTFDDGNGNSIVVPQTYNYDDTTDPDTPTLSDVTVDCNGSLTAPTTTDNCASPITGTTTDTLSFIEGGSTVINWTFDDGNGNSIVVPQTYNYDDTTDPDTPTLSDVTVDCNGSLTAPTTTDNCASPITGTTTDTLSFIEGGSTVINWTFDDGNGNSIVVPQTYNYDDTTDPDTPTLSDVTGECSATASAPTTTDTCEGTITGTTTTSFPITTQGTTVVTWTFDDGNGNSIVVPQNVIVDDITDPVCLAKDITIDLAGSTATITGSDIDNGSTDNCGISSLVASPNTFDGSDIGENTVTLTVTDSKGNSSTCDIIVTVEDSTLGSQDFDDNNLVNIYPNPFSNKLNINLPQSYLGTTVKIEIMDMRGRLIKTLNKEYVNEIVITEFDDFEDGSYFIKITNKSNKIIFKQLIKD